MKSSKKQIQEVLFNKSPDNSNNDLKKEGNDSSNEETNSIEIPKSPTHPNFNHIFERQLSRLNTFYFMNQLVN